ncbi:MAG: DUF4199 domain-containing protein [Cytophagales bacterium]|nr:DUF4199 domain-containing protein [Cytophagales bacterium]MCA6369380.1 DUF4199 domain-containing protein [Cytophagales bacterium]MCA6373585.1 DUF4199 domain-containing protein [Cytophagales bacterium]MCA6377989.1 DUF4199 domain-containing protein [Cytophagales bacterium]MCA6382660.1 DUF4199 domain-containing protein [Cytophagales bacterium]
MKRIILVYGLIAGTIVGSMFFITMPLYEKGILTMENGELVGYSTMIVALSLIFFGIKSYRDNHLEGSITFGKALKVGLLITLIASLIYAITWEIIYNTMTDFVTQMGDKYFEKLRAEGTTQAEIDEYKAIYENPFIRFAMTLMEIAPVGILISLLSAGLLRMRGFLPPSSNN